MENRIPRMRSVRQTATLTGLSEHTLRRWVKQNKIVFVRADTKILINVDRLLEFLNGGTDNEDNL